MARSTKHTDLVNDILKYLKSLPHCKAFPVYPGPWGNKGVADIIICYRGLSGVIEVKVGYDKPTKLQAIFLRDITNAKGEARVGRTLDDAKELIKFMDTKCVDAKCTDTKYTGAKYTSAKC